MNGSTGLLVFVCPDSLLLICMGSKEINGGFEILQLAWESLIGSWAQAEWGIFAGRSKQNIGTLGTTSRYSGR